ncbi:MAG: hypothetical protein ACR2MT_12895 [Aurantibacter sp.]
MKFNSFLNKTFGLIGSYALVFLLLTVSCSTDDVKDPALQDPEIEEMEDPMENEEPKDIPESGEIVFEENFILDESRSFVHQLLTQSEYDKFITGEGDLEMVSQKVYEYLDDDFDFIIILSVEETQPEDLFYGRSHPAQNQVQGLGIGTYDNSAAYGSEGKLKSIIYMPRTEYIRNGPFLHEIVHTWANKGIIPTTVGGHWGYASTAGQLGGFDELVDLGNNNYRGRLHNEDGFGTFANGGNSLPYGNLELYLMGLIGAEELEAVQVAVNPNAGNGAGEFSADAIDLYTPEDIISEHGNRTPSVQDSQKSFRALAVIISTTPIDQAKVDAVHGNLENFSRPSAPDSNWGGLNNFWMATQGKASFDFEVRQEAIK